LVLFHDFILTAKIYNKNEITGDASAFFYGSEPKYDGQKPKFSDDLRDGMKKMSIFADVKQ
jgi:hypothetical protein